MKQELWRRVEELFHAALERVPEARRAFLDEACGEDRELRQQVEVVVSKDEHAGSLLKTPVFADITRMLVAPAPSWAENPERMRSYLRLAPAGWARCTARTTASST